MCTRCCGPQPLWHRPSRRTGWFARCLPPSPPTPLATGSGRSLTRQINSSEPLTNNGAPNRPDAADLSRVPLVLDDLLENGQGVGRAGGLVAFVSGGLPGESVRIAVDAIKRNYVSAHAVAILEQSPDRVPSVCPVFGRCGGCQALHLRYEAQLAWKRRLVAQALARIGELPDVPVDEVVADHPSAAAGYRNKASLVVRAGKRVELGFYAARSHDLVAIDACPVLIPRLNAAVESLAQLASEAPTIFDGVRHIVARAGDSGKELVLSFNSLGPNHALRDALGEMRRRIPDMTGLVSNWDPQSENAVFGKRFSTLYGSALTSERICGALLRFGVGSFFQINTPILERVAARLLELTASSRRVVDLYCGVGTFGVVIGMHGVASTGVESHRLAVNEAAANAAANGVTIAAFECATAEDAVAGERGRTLLDGADATILDPPRKGCDPAVLAGVTRSRVPLIAYVSCNPATLARDAKILVGAGYQLERVTPFDMFPHTGHVEALAEFRRTS